MDESKIVEELERSGFTRRDFIKRTAAVGAGVTALGMLEIEPALGMGLDKVKWISPRGTLDVMRGRALTFVMSITFVLVGIGNVAGGLLLAPTGPRWIWGACGMLLLVAALAGSVLARKLRGETPAEAEVRAETTPVAAAH